MKILIAEDEPIIAENLYQLLLLLEYKPCKPVGNPAEAIALLQNTPIDLVLLDLGLENDQSGAEIAAYIYNHKLPIPFIVLTGYSDAMSIASVKKYHPAAYLIKPITRESLFAAIELATPGQQEEGSIEHELFLKTGTRYEKLNLEELLFAKANGKYTELHFPFGKRLIRTPLSTFLLDNDHLRFLRVHKSYAVNTGLITSYTADEIQINNQKIPIGRFFMPVVNTYLRKLTLSNKR